MPTVRSRSTRSLLLVTALACGSLLLAGCSAPEPSPSASSRATNTGSGEPEETSTPTPTVETVVSEPIDTTCEQLITADQMYNFNPNFSLLSEASPAEDTKAAQIAGMDGLVCQWKNDTSGDVIDVAVARLGDDDLTALKNLAVTESTQVPTYGAPPEVEGYFKVYGNQGEAQVFFGPYWVTFRSVAFFEPGDPIPLVESARGNLG